MRTRDGGKIYTYPISRKARLNIPGAIYHVMARCLDGQALFTDNQDREFYLSLLGPYLLCNNCRCYAWALMHSGWESIRRNFGSVDEKMKDRWDASFCGESGRVGARNRF